MWKKVLAVNVGLLLGCLVALSIAPAKTPLATFLLICLGAVLAVNIVVFLRPIRSEAARLSLRGDKFQSATIWILLALFLLLAFLMTRVEHP